jgi:hypothetical protein
MKKVLLVLVILVAGMLYLTSCYNNKYDILSLPKVSFVNEIVPIATSGACGCHNFSTTGEVKFSNGKDTIYYDAIYARGTVLRQWANDSISHPGGGTVSLTAKDKQIIKAWAAQGMSNDYIPANTTTGTVTYTANIAPMVSSTCSGGSCHGGAGPTLTYAILTSNISHLTQMANSGGAAGHPGGTITLSASVCTLMSNWIAQGTKQ